MSHAAPIRLRRLHPTAITRSVPCDEGLAMRLLRHQTKNALQRIIAQVSATELRATEAGSALADEIERRIRLSARVSDALFGLTQSPGPFDARLDGLCQSVVALMSDGVQMIRTDVNVSGICPEALETTVLQIAHEMVTNAIKHGLHMRLSGEIVVMFRGKRPGLPPNGLSLEVRDNGWGPEKAGFQEGLAVLQLLAQQQGGYVELVREPGWTISRLFIPAMS